MRKLILTRDEHHETWRGKTSAVVIGILGLILLWPVCSFLGTYLAIRVMQALGVA